MITKDIINLLKDARMSCNELSEKLNEKKTTVNSTLNYMFRRNVISREITRKTEQARGRKTFFLYRINDAIANDEIRVDVGQSGSVPDQGQSVASS